MPRDYDLVVVVGPGLTLRLPPPADATDVEKVTWCVIQCYLRYRTEQEQAKCIELCQRELG